MPPYYDIYGLSRQRDKKNVERFLNYFANREKVEDRQGQEIAVYKNEKYKTEEVLVSIRTLTEVIDFGLLNQHFGFAFYIGDHLKEGINQILLKFTFDGKIIFGISIEEHRIGNDEKLIDNYDKALEIEKKIAELTNAIKTSIQFEYAPADDEEEFDSDIEMWRNMNEEKSNKHLSVRRGWVIWRLKRIYEIFVQCLAMVSLRFFG